MPEDLVTDLERDLASLLAIEPSPEFGASVRRRIAGRNGSTRWALWGLASAAAVMLVAGGWMLRAVPIERPGRALTTSLASVPPPAPRVPAHSSSGSSLSTPAARPPRVARVRRAVESEVIIDPAFGAAVRRLLRSAQPPDSAALAAGGRATPLPEELSIVPVPVNELTIPIVRVGEVLSSERR